MNLETAERSAAKSAERGKAAYGIWSPAVTPLTATGSPDVERFAAHALWLLERGCDGIAVFGTTGEATSFGLSERMSLLESALAEGLPAAAAMVGTGCPSVADTLVLSRHAIGLGIQRLLVLPPYYYKGVSDEGVYRAYAELIEGLSGAQAKLFLYNFPRLSGVAISVGVVERLRAAYPEVVAGIKDSSGDPDSLRAYLGAFANLAIFPGSETLLLEGLKHGGAGCITASANLGAVLIKRVYETWSRDADAEGHQERISQIRAILQRAPMIPLLKHLLAHHHRDKGWRRVRPPLVELPGDLAASIEGELAAACFAVGQS